MRVQNGNNNAPVRIVPTAEQYAEGINRALDRIARERRYIGFVEGPPLEGTLDLIRQILAGEGVQFVAVTDANQVVGWCDILRHPLKGFRHTARMGMALLPEYRGAGLGRRLLTDTLAAARAIGIERVELEVFASNHAAIALYRRMGFVLEGTRRRARKLDGAYDDDLIMALFLDPPVEAAR